MSTHAALSVRRMSWRATRGAPVGPTSLGGEGGGGQRGEGTGGADGLQQVGEGGEEEEAG